MNYFLIYCLRYTFIFFHYRQVCPSPDNLVAKSLAPDIRSRNMRKVQISAKITFTIWILETILLVVLFLVVKIWQYQEFTMIFYVLFPHVLVPFTLLMNSSEAKECLVDVGFLDILRNTIRFSAQNSNDDLNPRIPTVACSSDAHPRRIPEIRQHEEALKLAAHLEKPFKSTKVKNPKKDNDSAISDFQNRFSIEMSDIFPTATTSHGRVYSPTEANISVMKRESPGSDESYSLKNCKDKHYFLAEEILEKMANNVEVESRYIFYLKELLRLEDEASVEAGQRLEDFQINEYRKVQFTRLPNTKNSQKYENKARDVLHSSSKLAVIDIDLNEQSIKFLGSFSWRHDMRKVMLKDFRKHIKDRASYKMFLNNLLDLEENLIEN